MDPSLLQLMEELLQSIEQRDAGDPDAPAWEASLRIRRLEEDLSRRLETGEARPVEPASTRPTTGTRDGPPGARDGLLARSA